MVCCKVNYRRDVFHIELSTNQILMTNDFYIAFDACLPCDSHANSLFRVDDADAAYWVGGFLVEE
jgi:hypothetical protein